MKKLALVLMVSVLLVSAFAGCAPKTEEPEPTKAAAEPVATEEPTATEEPVAPVVFNWNIGADPKKIDPGLNGATDGGDVINQTFEGLVREKSGVLSPGIAETWDASADGLTVTFHLRESKWSDGSDLTANDFVYSWLRAMDSATASEYSWIWEYTHVVNAGNFVNSASNQAIVDAGVGGLKDPEDPDAGVYTQEDVDTAVPLAAYTAADVGIKAVDNLTLEVQLESPTDYFVSLMAFYHFRPVKQASVEAGAEGTWAFNPELAVSNGPFKLTSYTIGDGLTLEKNEYFWSADTVGIDLINGKFIDDQNTAYQAYQNGELDFLPDVPPAEVPRLIAEDPNFYVFAQLGTYYYSFNLDKDIWADPNVRKALSMAIDRQMICDTLAAGQVPAAGFIPPGFLDDKGNDFFETAGTYGVAADNSAAADAQALLAEAGYPDGEGFPSFTISYNTSEAHQLVAELVQEMFKTNLGIECQLENQEWAVFQDTRKEGNYDMARGGWLTDFMDPIGLLGIFVPGNAYNDPNYDSADFNAAIDAAGATTDPAEHFAQLYKAQEIFINDMPIIPIYHYSDICLAAEKVIGWDRSVLGTLDFSSATIEN